MIIKVTKENSNKLVPLVANFRVILKSFKGIVSEPNVLAAQEELIEYLDSDFPVYAAIEDGNYIGYMVCRVDAPCVWVESIYVDAEYRRKGIASALFAEAEKLAALYGEETVYNYVHPNNHGMISFLKRHGYTVLNLIEIRKPRTGEALNQKIQVEGNSFDY